MTKVKVSKGHRATVKQSNTADAQTPSNQDGSFCDQIAACPIIQSMQEAIENMVPGGADWSTIQNKPTSFPPSAHTHTIPDVSGLTSALASAASISQLNAAITALKDGVPTAGDTLQKLYNLVITSQDQFTVENSAALAAFNVVNLNIQVFVLDDGDGRWALYKPATTGVGATWIKISDPDLLNAVLSAAQIKTAYESNPDTNAFTNALKSKLDSITAIFTTVLKDAYDTAATWVSTNSSAIANLLANTSGSNTGDETTATIQTKRPLKMVGGVSLEGTGNIPTGGVHAIRTTFTTHTLAAGSTTFMTTLGQVSTSEGDCQWAAETPLTILSILVRIRTAMGAQANGTYTIRVNGVDVLSLTIPSGSPAGNYLATAPTPIVVSPGSLVSWRRQNTGSSTTAQHVQFSIVYTL